MNKKLALVCGVVFTLLLIVGSITYVTGPKEPPINACIELHIV